MESVPNLGLTTRTVCGVLTLSVSGRKFGNCDVEAIKTKTEEAVGNKERLDLHRKALGASSLLAMHPEATRQVVSLSAYDTFFLGPFLNSTKPKCDALIRVPKHNRAVDGRAMFIANADCPIVAFADPLSPCWGLIHCGLGCLISREDQLDIITLTLETVLRDPQVKESDLRRFRFFVGCGVGPCCFGYPEGSVNCNLVREKAPEAFSGVVTNSSHSGNPGIDLRAIIFSRLFQRVPSDHIEIDTVCTSCAGLVGQKGAPAYFSHLREVVGRNRNGVGLFRP